MTLATHADDVAADAQAAAALTRPPLVIADALTAFLDERGLGQGPPAFERIGEGHSNATFKVTRGGEPFVLRRPPRPPVPRGTHDVLREARVMAALAGSDVPVPRVLAVCEDDSVIGAPFYVTTHLDGVVVTDAMPSVLDDVEARRDMGNALVDTLAALHAVDWEASGLAGFGRPDGYLARQVSTFSRLWDAHRTREVEAVDALSRWLGETMPETRATTIVHGDYRIGNLMFEAEPPVRVCAVLDWEMATLGDPLADLGYLTATYGGRTTAENAMNSMSQVTRLEGFPDVDELVERYETASGRSAAELGWYRVMALWKACVFLEGLYNRYRAGQTDDHWLRDLDTGIPALAEYAQELAAAHRT